MSVSVNANPIAVLNSVNLVVSLGLLALGIVLIIYGFKIPDEKCVDDKSFAATHAAASGSGGQTPPNKDCFIAGELKKDGSKTDLEEDVRVLRLVALITGFLLIIPFGLNVAEMVLVYFPNTGGISEFIGKLGGSANQKAYSMKSMHHNMHHEY